MTTQWPWGAGPAPALRCDQCGKRIGRRRLHCVLGDGARLLCSRCLSRRELHAVYYPDCPVRWHDMYDHGLSFATRAAAWFVLDNPETRTA
jgi:hypothetical protein